MDVIADHVSTAWSTNDLVSVLDSTNVTVQWSILADSLYNPTNEQGCGSVLRFGSGALSFTTIFTPTITAPVRIGRQPQPRFRQQRHLQLGHPLRLLRTNDVAPDFTNR